MATAHRASAAESITNSAVMAGAGGFLDAFTYVGHGHVFANAMTGNVVLLGVALARGEPAQALRHLVPICAFIAGVVAARLVLMRPLSRFITNPQLTCVLFETVFLLLVGCLPASFPDSWLTLGIAFVASLQLVTFSTVRGAAYASTFTTGNLRKFTESFVKFAFDRHDDDARVLSMAFASVCAAFFLGATIGGICTLHFANRAAWVVAAWLIVATPRFRGTLGLSRRSQRAARRPLSNEMLRAAPGARDRPAGQFRRGAGPGFAPAGAKSVTLAAWNSTIPRG